MIYMEEFGLDSLVTILHVPIIFSIYWGLEVGFGGWLYSNVIMYRYIYTHSYPVNSKSINKLIITHVSFTN